MSVCAEGAQRRDGGGGGGAEEVQCVLGAASLFGRLGLPDAPSELAALRRRYREVALGVHPDKCAHPLAKEAFQKLSEAFDRLSSEDGQQSYLHKLGLAASAPASQRKRRARQQDSGEGDGSSCWWDTATWEEFERRLRHREATEAALRRDFEHSVRARHQQKRLRAQVLAAERSAEHCDRSAGLRQSDLWPSASEAGARHAELDDFASASARLTKLLLHLRTVHAYCFFCGCAFKSLADLERNCPGSTEEAHEEGGSISTSGAGRAEAAVAPTTVAVREEDPLDTFMAGLHEDLRKDMKEGAASVRNRNQPRRGWSFEQQEQQNKNERKRLRR